MLYIDSILYQHKAQQKQNSKGNRPKSRYLAPLLLARNICWLAPPNTLLRSPKRLSGLWDAKSLSTCWGLIGFVVVTITNLNFNSLPQRQDPPTRRTWCMPFILTSGQLLPTRRNQWGSTIQTAHSRSIDCGSQVTSKTQIKIVRPRVHEACIAGAL